MPSGKDYANRLQEEIHRAFSAKVSSVEKEIRNFQNLLSSSLAQIAERLSPVSALEVPEAEALFLEAIREADERNNEEKLFLTHFAHDMRRKETQEEMLTLLLDGAYRYAPRVALFVVRENQFVGWASRGFSESVAGTIGQSAIPRAASVFLEGSLEAGGFRSLEELSGEAALLQLVGGEATTPWHAFPMRAIQRPIAVLLVAPDESRRCDVQSLYLGVELTGLCIENMALKILQEMKEKKTRPETPRVAQPHLAAEASLGSPDFELRPSPQASDTGGQLARQEGALRPGADSVSAAAAATAPPVEETAWAESALETQPTHRETVFQKPAFDAGAQEAFLPEAESAREHAVIREISEEEKLHSDAKRFARLLVSEIKLYNEQRILEGRENRDIYVRLKRDIDRSRDMYEKRVSPSVSRKIDYFHDEVIRILGENDPATLGSDYPGPRVES